MLSCRRESNIENPILKLLFIFLLLAAAGFAADDFAETKTKVEVGYAPAELEVQLSTAGTYRRFQPRAWIE